MFTIQCIGSISNCIKLSTLKVKYEKIMYRTIVNHCIANSIVITYRLQSMRPQRRCKVENLARMHGFLARGRVFLPRRSTKSLKGFNLVINIKVLLAGMTIMSSQCVLLYAVSSEDSELYETFYAEDFETYLRNCSKKKIMKFYLVLFICLYRF